MDEFGWLGHSGLPLSMMIPEETKVHENLHDILEKLS